MSQALSRYHTYTIRIRFTTRCMGGTPKDPKIVEGWIKANAGVTDEMEVRRMVERTMQEVGLPLDSSGEVDMDLVEKTADQIAAEKETNGFKEDPVFGIYLDARCVKAMLREVCNILFAGEKWGKTKKGARSYLNERVHVEEDRLYFGKPKPDGVEPVIGHVVDRNGPRSTLALVEYVEPGSELAFHLKVLDDSIEADKWPAMLELMELNGLGAMRSMGRGRFEIVSVEHAGPSKLASRFQIKESTMIVVDEAEPTTNGTAKKEMVGAL